MRFRPTRASDLRALYEVWRAAAHPGRADTPPADAVLPLFRHQLTAGSSWVAEEADGLAGYAASFTRGGVGFLSDLFVVPARQSRGIGAALLDRALPPFGGTRCTMSSLDPRALAVYARAGVRPRWPNLLLASTAPDFTALPGADIAVAPADAGDPAFVEWDARIGGRLRPDDHAFWREIGGVPLWFTRGGVRVGYGYVYAWPGIVPRGPEARLGPLGAESAEDAAPCVGAALRWVGGSLIPGRDPNPAPGGWTYLVAVPAAHLALEPLLGARFRILGMEIFCSSRADPFCDLRAYLALAGPEGTSIF